MPGADSLRVSDPELRRAIQLVENGDYALGLKAIDSALSALGRAPGRRRDRALGELYAAVALLARGEAMAARERCRRALGEDVALTLNPDEFPPKLTALFSAARADLTAGAPAAGLRMLHATSGAAGAARGSTFVVDDPRSTFHVPGDGQAVVYFEWEAAPGSYRLRGTWRDPRGRQVPQPEIAVESRDARVRGRRNWGLALPESVMPGQWTLEVSRDGQPVGQHAIQVLALQPEREAEIDAGDLYAKVRASLVLIEKRDADGHVFGRGLGFFIAPDRVATAFQVVDGARSLLLRLSDGRSLVCDRVAAWDRWHDWALLDVAASGVPALSLSSGPPQTERRYRVLDLDADGKPYLARPVVVVLTTVPGKARERLTLGAAGGVTDVGFRLLLARDAAGGPVVDARREVVGIVGGTLIPGEASADAQLALSASLATPASLVDTSRGPGASLAQLIANGESLEPCQPGELAQARLTRAAAAPAGETGEFSRRDGQLSLAASFTPRGRRRALLRARIYDLDGALLADGNPVRDEFIPGQSQTVSWNFDLAKLPLGVQRVDLLDESQPVWRGYFRLGE